MMVARVTAVSAEIVSCKLVGSGSYEVLAAYWPAAWIPTVGDLVAIDELHASPGAHVIVAELAG